MKIKLHHLVYLIMILIFLRASYYAYRLVYFSEYSHQKIWAAIVNINDSYSRQYIHDKKMVAPIFFKNKIKTDRGYYDLLGVQSNDKYFPYTWIITNIHFDNNDSLPERVYIVFNGAGNDFYLPCSYVVSLVYKEKIDYVVSEYLRKKCNPSKV